MTRAARLGVFDVTYNDLAEWRVHRDGHLVIYSVAASIRDARDHATRAVTALHAAWAPVQEVLDKEARSKRWNRLFDSVMREIFLIYPRCFVHAPGQTLAPMVIQRAALLPRLHFHVEKLGRYGDSLITAVRDRIDEYNNRYGDPFLPNWKGHDAVLVVAPVHWGVR